MDSREADLAAYYDQDAASRAARAIDPRRIERRERFAGELIAQHRLHLLEIGTGPGHDAAAFLSRGVAVSGVDLSAEHVRLCRAAGVDAHVASVQHLPFPDDSFDAAWTMSTLLHVPDADFDAALLEIRRVLTPGSPLAVGLWGGSDSEGLTVDDEIDPPRFFSFRSHDRVQEMLGRHGALEQFETWSPDDEGSWTYQWALLRLA
jgi:SAM-dependent methyltransferase